MLPVGQVPRTVARRHWDRRVFHTRRRVAGQVRQIRAKEVVIVDADVVEIAFVDRLLWNFLHRYALHVGALLEDRFRPLIVRRVEEAGRLFRAREIAEAGAAVYGHLQRLAFLRHGDVQADDVELAVGLKLELLVGDDAVRVLVIETKFL
jgi:hypothetical protein